jgi:hypothetical protein
MKRTILELINQRQRQVLVHSILYYNYNESLVSDSDWSRWSKELVELMKLSEAKQSVLYKEFLGFEGDSGCDLDLCNEEAVKKAEQLLKWRDL